MLTTWLFTGGEGGFACRKMCLQGLYLVVYIELKCYLGVGKKQRGERQKQLKKPQQPPLSLGPAGKRSRVLPHQDCSLDTLYSAGGADHDDDFSPHFPLAWRTSHQDPLRPTVACPCSRWDQGVHLYFCCHTKKGFRDQHLFWLNWNWLAKDKKIHVACWIGLIKAV